MASQLPMAAAWVLLLTHGGSEHQTRWSFSGGVVHVTLHHAADRAAPHHHQGCEKLLFGESDTRHGDHQFAAGSSETGAEPDPTVSCPNAAIAGRDLGAFASSILGSTEIAVLAPPIRGNRGDPPFMRRPGVVMRL